MTKPLYIQAIAIYGFIPNPAQFSISMTPVNLELRDCGGNYGRIRNVSIDVVEDIPNNKFLSAEDALNYWYDQDKNTILGEVNTALGSTIYHLGERVTCPNGIIEYAQPKSENLDEFSDIALAPEIKALLQSEDEADLADSIKETISNALNLGSAAEHSEEDFAPASHSHESTDITDFEVAVENIIEAQKGEVNGLVPLGGDGKIASDYLPSYVDDVLEVADLASLPVSGEAGKIYLTLDTNKTYRWSGSSYVGLNESAGLGTVLAGYAAAGSRVAISTSDTILQAFSKVGKFLSDLQSVAFTGSYDDLTDKPTIPTVKAFEETTERSDAFPIFKNATVSGGTAVFHLTDNGASNGNALFPNGIIEDSIQTFVNDASAAYQFSYALTNSNKTLTVTANKAAPTGVIALLSLNLLGAPVAANGAVVKLQVWGY